MATANSQELKQVSRNWYSQVNMRECFMVIVAAAAIWNIKE